MSSDWSSCPLIGHQVHYVNHVLMLHAEIPSSNQNEQQTCAILQMLSHLNTSSCSLKIILKMNFLMPGWFLRHSGLHGPGDCSVSVQGRAWWPRQPGLGHVQVILASDWLICTNTRLWLVQPRRADLHAGVRRQGAILGGKWCQVKSHMRIKWSVDNNDITVQGHQEHSAQRPRLLGPRVPESFSECQELHWRTAEQEIRWQTKCKESSKPWVSKSCFD